MNAKNIEVDEKTMSFERREGSQQIEAEISRAPKAICESITSRVEKNILPLEGSEESWNRLRSTISAMEMHKRNSHEGDQGTMSSESSSGVLYFKAETSNAALQAVGVSESMLPPEGSEGPWTHLQSAISTLVDLKASNSHKCEQITISPERKEELLNLKAETGKAITETVVDSKGMLPLERSEREQSTLFAKSSKGVLNLKAERRNATLKSVSQNMLHLERSEESWNHPKSAVLALLALHTSNIHEGDHNTLSAESSNEFLSVEPETSNAAVGAIGLCKSTLSPLPEKTSGSRDRNISSKPCGDFNTDSNHDDNKKLHSGWYCGICTKSLNRHERISYVYKLKCKVLNDEKENLKEKGRKSKILKENDNSQYLVHLCDIQKGTLPPTRKIECDLCLEDFRCYYNFECHLKKQHKVNVFVLCDFCKMCRSYYESHATRVFRKRRNK